MYMYVCVCARASASASASACVYRQHAIAKKHTRAHAHTSGFILIRETVTELKTVLSDIRTRNPDAADAKPSSSSKDDRFRV